MKKRILIIAIGLMTFDTIAQTWNQISVPTNEKLNDIEFIDITGGFGYIGGDNGTLLKTIDGGFTWTPVSHTGITAGTYHFIDLDFVTTEVGYAIIGDFEGLYKTTDGGVTWSLIDHVDMGNLCYKQTLFVMDEDNFYAAGAGCFQSAMFKEFNSGVWTEKVDEHETFDPSQYITHIDFRGNLGLAAVHDKYILRSIDGGENWDTIPTPISAGFLTSVVIKDDLIAYAGYDALGGGFGVLKSVDGGLTWLEEIGMATFFYPSYDCMEVSQTGAVYAGGQPSNFPGGIVFDAQDGVSWNYVTVDQPLNAFGTYASNCVFAVGDSGYVITNTDLALLGIDTKIEVEFEVYPNPIVSEVTLKLPGNVKAIVEIMDLSLKIVEVPVHVVDNLTMTFDCTNLAKGTYIIRLYLPEGVQMRKIVKI